MPPAGGDGGKGDDEYQGSARSKHARFSRDGPEPSRRNYYRMTHPRRAACTTASVRLATPSLERMEFTWNFTV